MKKSMPTRNGEIIEIDTSVRYRFPVFTNGHVSFDVMSADTMIETFNPTNMFYVPYVTRLLGFINKYVPDERALSKHFSDRDGVDISMYFSEIQNAKELLEQMAI